MYAVELDQSKRLLVISAAQRVTAQQVKAVAERVHEVLQGLARVFAFWWISAGWSQWIPQQHVMSPKLWKFLRKKGSPRWRV